MTEQSHGANEANEFDGAASEQSNHFEDTETHQYDDRLRGQFHNFEAGEANEHGDRTREQPRNYFEATEANEYDDRTLLDTFGQVAKEFLTKKVIPDTDADCKWDWRSVRCGKFFTNSGVFTMICLIHLIVL